VAERRLRARTRARAHARTHARHPQTPRPPHRQEGATTIAIEIVALDEELDTADVLRAIKHKIRKDFIVISGDLVTDVFFHHLAGVRAALLWPLSVSNGASVRSAACACLPRPLTWPATLMPPLRYVGVEVRFCGSSTIDIQ